MIYFHFTRECLVNNEISFCHSMKVNTQWDEWYLLLRILMKPEEFQIIIPAALVTPSGIAGLILKAILWNKIVIIQLRQWKDHHWPTVCYSNQINHTSYFINTKTSSFCCHHLLSQAFSFGTSPETLVIRTAQAASFRLQYFPLYVWCSHCSCHL